MDGTQIIIDNQNRHDKKLDALLVSVTNLRVRVNQTPDEVMERAEKVFVKKSEFPCMLKEHSRQSRKAFFSGISSGSSWLGTVWRAVMIVLGLISSFGLGMNLDKIIK